MSTPTTTGICPECETRIRLENPVLGALIRCPECNTALEVIRVAPLRFDWAYDEPVTAEEELFDDRFSNFEYDEDDDDEYDFDGRDDDF